MSETSHVGNGVGGMLHVGNGVGGMLHVGNGVGGMLHVVPISLLWTLTSADEIGCIAADKMTNVSNQSGWTCMLRTRVTGTSWR